MYSIAAAAAATGLSQTTLLRAIQAGHISSTRNGFNEWQVDPAELHRLYDPKESQRGARRRPIGRRCVLAEQRLCAQEPDSTTWRRPSDCPVSLILTSKRSRPRGHVGGA
jgi:hypothetical protein